MNYNADKPIETKEQDLLGRASFSNQLGKAIYDYSGKDGLVIGLYGRWGTGKTSVINIAVNEINRLAENDENKPLIIRFAPWNYSDRNNLISLFFQGLKNKINILDNEEQKKKIGKALNDYSGAFDALSLVPIVGSGIAAVLKTIAQVQGASLMQDVDLDKTKAILEDALVEANKKIVIVIDDIDRLSNSQIRDVFQLVKQVADFPNVIYLLAMDREVVRGALSEVHNIDGNEYLEKIIQIPFEIPELRKSKLNSILFSKLDQILKNLPKEVTWSQDYWNRVFQCCVEPFINTIRDVNRVINTFQFRYGMVYEETSFEDMIGITTLEVLEPQLYKWICNNKDAVCGGFMHALVSTGRNKPDYRKLYHDEFEGLGIDPDKAIRCISTLFPVFAKNVQENQYGYQRTTDIKKKMRIADEGRFDIYFMFDLDDVKVPRSIIKACVHDLDRDLLIQVIKEVNDQGNIIYFIDEMRSFIEEIPYNRLSLIASVMLGLQDEFQGETSKLMFTLSSSDSAEYLATDIIKRLETEEEKNEIIRCVVERANRNSLGAAARLISRLETAYGRTEGSSEDKDEQFISVEHLEELEQIYVSKIREISATETLLDMGEFKYIFYLWKRLDKDGVDSYIKELFKNEINKLRFLCAVAGRWNGTNGSGWSFYSKDYEEYVSSEEAYSLIQGFDKNKLEEFTKIEQIKLASFALNINKREYEMVNEQSAEKLLHEWEDEKAKS